MEGTTEFDETEQQHIRELVMKHKDRLEKDKKVEDVAAIMMRLIEDLNKNPTQKIEDVLRQEESSIYLLAWPVELSNKVKEGDIESKLPLLGKKKYPNFLHVAYGDEQLNSALIQLETNYERNYQNLSATGLPYPKPGSLFAREMKYRDN